MTQTKKSDYIEAPGGHRVQLIVDARGLRCPMPLLKAKQALNRLEAGSSLWVIATDIGSQKDIPAFCRLSGNPLQESRVQDDEYHFVLTKKSEGPL